MLIFNIIVVISKKTGIISYRTVLNEVEFLSKLFNSYIKSYTITPETEEEYFSLVRDLYFSDEVQSLAQYEQHLEINRLQHVTSVSFISYKIAKKLKLDYRMIARGTLLHDLFYYDWRDASGNWHRPHGYKHPVFAYYNAQELNKDISEPEKDMILHHMFPLTLSLPKYKESYILIFSDKYCAAQELIYSLSKSYRRKIDLLIKGK